jgi:hypothetical protein
MSSIILIFDGIVPTIEIILGNCDTIEIKDNLGSIKDTRMDEFTNNDYEIEL